MLKYLYENAADIPEKYKDLYQEGDLTVGGKTVRRWILQVEGGAPKVKLDEFRENNIALGKTVDRLKKVAAVIGDVDTVTEADAQAFKAKADSVKGTKTQEEIDALVNDRLKKAKEAHDAELRTVREERDKVANQLSEVKISSEVLEVGSEFGLLPTAALDITTRARQVFTVRDGAVVAFEADGTTKKVGADGFTPLTVKEWVGSLSKEATHLFNPSKGSGAAGGGSGGTNKGTKNPWTQEHWNLTEQGRITKENPALAAQLKAQAPRGVRK